VGFDFASVNGDQTYRLNAGWMSVLLDALDCAGLFDWVAIPPDPPPGLNEKWDDPPSADWPFDRDLTEDELTFFGFRSSQAELVAGRKLVDNELWLLTPPESWLIHECAQSVALNERSRALGERSFTRLAEMGIPSAAVAQEVEAQLLGLAYFAGESSALGGFWAH
jgi:hypothetical protein